MKRMARRGVAYALAAAALPLLAGCPKQQSTMDRPPEINPPPAVERSAEARTEELGDLARRFASTAQRLPGRTPDEHRAAVQQVFTELSQILPVLFGPDPEGSQRQQLRVVESARSQLAAAPQGLAPEPTIDTGLRAANDALSTLARNRYFEQAQLGQTADRLAATVKRLDTSRGVPHQQTVSEVVDLMSELVTGMARTMDDRLEEQQQEQAGSPPSDGGADKPDAGKRDGDAGEREADPGDLDGAGEPDAGQ